MNKEDYSKYYIQGSDHYLIPKDVFDELFNEMSNWRDESKQLKEVIEEVREYVEDRISVLTVSVDNKAKDQYFNDKCIGGVQELKHIRHLLQILDKAKDSDD